MKLPQKITCFGERKEVPCVYISVDMRVCTDADIDRTVEACIPYLRIKCIHFVCGHNNAKFMVVVKKYSSKKESNSEYVSFLS